MLEAVASYKSIARKRRAVLAGRVSLESFSLSMWEVAWKDLVCQQQGTESSTGCAELF